MKRCSTSLIIRETRIETAVRSVKIAVIKQTNKRWPGYGGEGSHALQAGMQTGAPLENGMGVSQKVKGRTTV